MQLQNEYLQPSSLFARNFTGQETLIVYAIRALISSPAQNLHTPSIFLFSHSATNNSTTANMFPD